MDLNLLFTLANVYVLPFWLLMIVLPNWEITKKVMQSYLVFLPLIILYIYLFVGALDPESIGLLASPELPGIAQAFGSEGVAFTGWVHFLTLDLFLGRYVYFKGQETNIWTIHSLIICLFAGPIGLLSHIVTVWVSDRFSQPSEVT